MRRNREGSWLMHVLFSGTAAFESVSHRLLGSHILLGSFGSCLAFLALVEACFCELLFGELLL